MSTKKFDSFKDLTNYKYNWKVPAGILNMWRGFSKAKEAFKSFNLLLVDNKRARIHAFVPGAVADYLEKDLAVGGVYLFQNFTVKDYEQSDIFRPFRKEIQIVFDDKTEITPFEEAKVSIDRYVFDIYDLSNLEPMSKQRTYLTDVAGVMQKPKPLSRVKNKNGQIQLQVKFKITDGSNTVKVTFWDEFAVQFDSFLKQKMVFPVVIIIGSCKVTKWSDELDIGNDGPTTFHINIPHHSVTEMKRRLNDLKFDKSDLFAPTSCYPTLCKVAKIKTFGPQQIEIEVLAQLRFRKIQLQSWFVPTCTSCYHNAGFSSDVCTCLDCKRDVPYPDKKYQVCVFASDDTGAIDVMLEDREVRKVVGKTVFQILDEGPAENALPIIVKSFENKDFTVKLIISKENIEKQFPIYTTMDIMAGFDLEYSLDEESIPHPIESMDAQPSGSSFHIDTLSGMSNSVSAPE